MKVFNKIIPLFANLLSLFFFSCSVLAITLDGKLNDNEWSKIPKQSHFVTTTPFSLNTPEYQTDVQYYSDRTGIYFAITNHQPFKTQRRQRSSRDAHMNADYNNIVIDFDNNGLTAYSFTISNGGSIEDGTYRNENKYSYEWNGVWEAKTSFDEKHWYVEVHIPWDVAPMIKNNSSERLIGLYVSRRAAHLSKSYSDSPIKYNRQRFLSRLNKVGIKDFSKSSLQIFGYASSRSNRVSDEVSHKAGVDLFWKPLSHQQLSLTINPDFGQIESDQLVVNFSPTETFFTENRPFFTENQALFDLQGAESLRLVHTRRIGSTPDVGSDVSADLHGAIKFSSVSESVNYGFFSAIEDEGDYSSGRNYYVARVIGQRDNFNLGYLITYTDRPDIDRTAMVQAIDYDLRINPNIKLTSQLIRSSIAVDQEGFNDHGAWLEVEHQFRTNWSQSLALSYYGDEFQIDDLGFLPRNDLTTMTYTNSWQDHVFLPSSPLKEHRLNLSLKQQENNAGLKLGSTLSLSDTWSWKDSSQSTTTVSLSSSGSNDRLTRGNHSISTKSGYQVSLLYYSPNQDGFNFHASTDVFNQMVKGKGISAHLHPTYYFTDSFSADIGIWYSESKDWLIWQQLNQLNSYQKQQLTTRLGFNATINEKQELSLKVEWLALNADGSKSFEAGESGQLLETFLPVSSFAISDTSVQLRYRYEISPLSNIYVVYSRGGRTNLDAEESIGSLFSPGWEARDGDNFLVKVRYQF